MTATSGRAIADVIQAREDVLKAVLAAILAERHLADDPASTQDLDEAEAAMALAGRQLAWATDLIPVARQPRGWQMSRPDGYLLISPQCQRNAFRECDGSPCEHPVHSEDAPGVKW